MEPELHLSEEQHRAVTSGARRVVVLAAAGSGKTRVLTERIRRRIELEEVSPDHVLATTFSRRAADELRRRLWRVGIREVRAKTFHATALEIVREHRERANLAPPQLLVDRRGLLVELSRSRQVAGLDQEITWAKSNLVSPEAYAAASRGRRPPGGAARFNELYASYEAQRRRSGQLDFDDLIAEATRALEEDLPFASGVRFTRRHLFVDEFQDVNPAQLRLFEAIAAADPDFFVVGDPNQSIYGFNGADPRLLGSLPSRYREVEVLELASNHRSTPAIVATASAVLGMAFDGTTGGELPRIAAFANDEEEAAAVASSVADFGPPFAEQAVLARTNAQLVAVAAALGAIGVPTRTAGAEHGPRGLLGTGEGWADAHDEDAVALSTFHRAKGLEWTSVYVVGAAEGIVPMRQAGANPLALAEEQRAFYVALSRARRRLAITWARAPGDGSGGEPTRQPSRWLEPLAARIAELEAVDAPLPPEQAVARAREIRASMGRGVAS